MTLLHPKVEPAEVHEPDAEALIREARRLRRRRWMLGCLVVVLVIGGIVAGLVASGGTGRRARRTTLAFRAGGPTVDAKAFAGEGDLAFVSRGTVYVLDGAKTLRHLVLPSGSVPGAPSFSHDGRWLAIPATSRVTAPNGDGSTLSTLWLADADGSRLHKVTGFDNPEFLGWSPTSDVLAVTNQGEVSTTYTPPPGSGYVTQPTSLWVVSPSGARRELVRPGPGMIDGATWAPNGSAVAVGGLSAYPFQDHVPWTETLTAYPVDGAKPTVWLRIVNPRSNSCCQTAGLKQSQFVPVGWWPHWGIVFWGPSADVGSGLVGGGFPLFAIPASGDKPVPLGRSLAGGQVGTIVASANGDLAISDNPGNSGARPFWQDEQVLTCHPTTLSCGPVRSAAGTISFDPVWAPDGSQLAYLVGKEVGGESEPGFLQSPVSSWYNSLQLWLYSTRTGRSTELPAAKGAVMPIWSADSKSLLYIDNDGLWLLKTPKSQPSEVTGPLLPSNDWNPYYAQVHWAGLFAWSRSQNVPQPGVLTPM
jgi:hypothetical protein